MGTNGVDDDGGDVAGRREGPVVWTIVVAGGGGLRFGGPKQFLLLGGERIIDRSIAAAAESSDGVVAVVPAGYEEDSYPGADTVVVGGLTRSASVRAGLAAVPAEVDVILVHDAARPLATPQVFRAVIDAVGAGADAVIPAVAVIDTIKRTAPTPGGGRRVDGTVDREGLVSVQTPQGFRASVLRAAHENDGDATDDAALVEDTGAAVEVVAGDLRNIKVTVPSDILVAEVLIG